MRARTSVLLGICTAITMAGAQTANAQTGNGAPSGSHYNLNIIGSKSKNPKMTGTSRHTIFVPLSTQGGTSAKIYLTPGDHFEVCDGNAFDPAYDCTGNQIQSIGAVFMLPCNSNLTAGTDPDGEPSTLFPCDETAPGYIQSYEVWVRELGKPGGGATMTTCADEVTDVNGNSTLEHVCSTENVVLTRTKGKSTFSNVTQELTSLVACYDVNTDPTITDIDCFRYALFRDELEDWVWEYDNNNLRLAQLRFYPGSF
jgi:hypothetical protein